MAIRYSQGSVHEDYVSRTPLNHRGFLGCDSSIPSVRVAALLPPKSLLLLHRDAIRSSEVTLPLILNCLKWNYWLNGSDGPYSVQESNRLVAADRRVHLQANYRILVPHGDLSILVIDHGTSQQTR